MKKYFLFFLLFKFFNSAFAQTTEVNSYPTHWWAGMKNPVVQIMLHGKNIGSSIFSFNYPGVKLQKIYKAENPNYVFIDLFITTAARPGTFKIKMNDKGESREITFELKSRKTGNGKSFAQGVTSKDFMYLIMPDRFSMAMKAMTGCRE